MLECDSRENKIKVFAREYIQILPIALYKLKKRFKDLLPEDYIPTFFREHVLVPTTNVKDAFVITDAVLSAQAQSGGKVNIVPLETPEDYEETENKILNKYVTLTPGEDIVLYRILDIPPYVASMLVPTGSDILLIQSNKE